MSAVHLRERRQVTLPSDVVSAAGLETNDSLDVSYVNGVIYLVPVKGRPQRTDVGLFVGACGASYGSDTEAMNRYVREQRDSW